MLKTLTKDQRVQKMQSIKKLHNQNLLTQAGQVPSYWSTISSFMADRTPEGRLGFEEGWGG
jgi:hypothetical protein